MSTYVKGSSLRELIYGQQVLKPATALPATATANLYTVTGGAVLITGLFGLVSTVCSSTATTLAIGTAPTVGTTETAGIATATAVTSLEAGTFLGVQAASGVAGALVSGAHAGNAVFLPAVALVVSAGYITVTTSATNTGAISWYLTYVPLDTGASVS